MPSKLELPPGNTVRIPRPSINTGDFLVVITNHYLHTVLVLKHANSLLIPNLNVNMSLIPHFHRGGLSAVSRLVDNYENMFSNLGQLQTYAPSFDVRETEKAYHLDGDLPGVQEKDLEIEFEDEHCLKIKAHSERESTTEKDSWLASERLVRDFWRTFNFPTAIDQDHTHAHLKNGVLSLEIPKSVRTQGKKKVNIVD
jgi:HSP20 family protein